MGANMLFGCLAIIRGINIRQPAGGPGPRNSFQ